VEQIEQDSDHDRWCTPDEAKAYGLIDAVSTEAAAVRVPA
jgi:ATP-dependent Clp protease, protease subunit